LLLLASDFNARTLGARSRKGFPGVDIFVDSWVCFCSWLHSLSTQSRAVAESQSVAIAECVRMWFAARQIRLYCFIGARMHKREPFGASLVFLVLLSVCASCSSAWPETLRGQFPVSSVAQVPSQQHVCARALPADKYVACREACVNEDAGACDELMAFILQSGVNKWNELELWKSACEFGSLNACVLVGSAHREGVLEGLENAERYYAKGCRGGSAVSCVGLLWELSDTTSPSRRIEAVDLAKLLCDGHQDACVQFVEPMTRSPYEARGALSVLTACCELGEAHACVLRAARMLDLETEPAVTEAANQALDGLCVKGQAEACFLRGQRLESAAGCSLDDPVDAQSPNDTCVGLEELVLAYMQACSLGHVAACEHLGTMQLSDVEAERISVEQVVDVLIDGCDK